MADRYTLPLVVVNWRGRASMRASRPIYRLPDDGLGARIAGEVRAVHLDTVGGMEFVWYDHRCPGRAYALDWPELACPRWVADAYFLPHMLNEEEGWSPPAVLLAALRGFRDMLGLTDDEDAPAEEPEGDPFGMF